MSDKLKRFTDLLKEMFEIDKADLDFGLYRILKLRKNEIENFIDNDLPYKVKEILSSYTKDNLEIKNKMKKIEDSCNELGVSIEELPDTSEKKRKYMELKKSLESGTSLTELETDVYSKLYNFFSRYYDEGDFISKRRYKEGIYAIPYEGEEVKLYWANHDQYYIKTSEYFKNYSFISQGIKVNFKLVDVSTEKDNNKEAKDEKRRFVLLNENFVEVSNNEINIYFEYKVHTARQDTLVKSAYEKIKSEISKIDSKYLNAVLIPAPTEKDKTRTLLEKHLTTYVAKNTFDYFIHKNLKRFLKRELDFYIKSEVMKLDDIGTEKEERVESYLSKIRAIKSVGEIIIDFLVQIEDFQKKLWLKKKFVVETNWCITLDLIDEKFYPEIAANQKQINEWIEYYKIDEIKNDDKQIKFDGIRQIPFSTPLTVEFLKQNKNLVLDTKYFDNDFKERLIESIDNLDERTSGLLIHSENFQALNLLQEKYKEKIQCIYIDPPYNTNASEIIYKNGYKHSSWLSLMKDRLDLSKNLMSNKGTINVAIDDFEFRYLQIVLESTFGINNFISNIAIHTNPKGRDQEFIAQSHDYSIIYAKNKKLAETNYFILSNEELREKYSHSEGDRYYRELPLKRTGSGKTREERPFMFFPFLYNPKTGETTVIPKPEYLQLYDKETKEFNDDFLLELEKKYTTKGYKFILPKEENGTLLRWRWGYDTCVKGLLKNILFAKETGNGNFAIYEKNFEDSTVTPKSMWIGEKYDGSTKGTNLLKDIIPNNDFDFPKSIFTVMDSIRIGANTDSIILDYFAGSGTTGHAVINLNREDKENGNRKYILVEMGNYFDLVTLPRIKKVIYSDEWKDGAPTNRVTGVSQIVKYLRLESYEDTLNNINFIRNEQQQSIFDSNQNLFEEYLVYYMFDMESKDSVLNLDNFANPFDYKMRITTRNVMTNKTIDLVETFNYLIGLDVISQNRSLRFNTRPIPYDEKDPDIYDGAVLLESAEDGEYCFKTVEGKLPNGQSALVIWRNMTGDALKDNAALDAFFNYYHKNSDRKYDIYYVNGDNNLENYRKDDENWKVNLIETVFKNKMFDYKEI